MSNRARGPWTRVGYGLAGASRRCGLVMPVSPNGAWPTTTPLATSPSFPRKSRDRDILVGFSRPDLK